jgi:hypothetical protein
VKVFISWSGQQTKPLGHALQVFIETTFASHVHSFLSDSNIAPGERFLSVIDANLGAADLGILLVTRANQSSPWLLFEAGALAGKSQHGSVIPILIDLERVELEPPLGQFQNVLGTSREQVRKLCERIHQEAGSVPAASIFELLFEQAWPALGAALEAARQPSEVAPAAPRRNVDEVLAEILAGVNALVQRPARNLGGWSTPTAAVRDNGNLKLEKGQRLRHEDFGEGTVTGITGEGVKTVAHVMFDEAGAKKLLVKIAPIEVM